MELIKEIIIENPPTFYEIYKKKKSIEAGAPVYDKYYLTSNLFFNNGVSYFVISKIVEDCKLFLFEHMKGIPKLEKMRLEIEYHSDKHIDLDNRLYFWTKLFLDILKSPTKRQEANYAKKGKRIISTFTIYDDTTQYIDDIRQTFKLGGKFMIFRIYGRATSTQQELKL